mgnify:CR=1 FL=1
MPATLFLLFAEYRLEAPDYSGLFLLIYTWMLAALETMRQALDEWLEAAARPDAGGFSKPVTLRGEGGNDTLLGGTAGDVLHGGNENDLVNRQAGDDTFEVIERDDNDARNERRLAGPPVIGPSPCGRWRPGRSYRSTKGWP